MPIFQLLAKSLVECQCARLGTAIIHHFPDGNEARRARDSNDVSPIRVDDSGQELLQQQEMRYRVDLEGLADFMLGFFDYATEVEYTCIVNQDRRVPVCGSDARCELGDGFRGGDVCFVEIYIFWEVEGRGFDVQHYDA